MGRAFAMPPTDRVWLGVNFWSRIGGPRMWPRYDAQTVTKELQVLADHGLTMTRSFFFWPDFMSTPDTLDETLLDQFADFLERQEAIGLRTVPTLIVGHCARRSCASWPPSPASRSCWRSSARRPTSSPSRTSATTTGRSCTTHCSPARPAGSPGTPKSALRELADFRAVLDVVDIARCTRADTEVGLVVPAHVDSAHPFTDERDQTATLAAIEQATAMFVVVQTVAPAASPSAFG